MPDYKYSDIAKMIDHSLLNPTLTVEDLKVGIQMARLYDVASVCILPYALKMCADELAGTSVQPSTTVGFPHGGHATSTKVKEAETAISEGCTELDMVVNISQALSGNWNYVYADIMAVTDVAHGAGQKIKVIFENCYLNDQQKIKLCEICNSLNVDWVKTSTGYGKGGATAADLKIMRKHTLPHVQVKAAGGVRTLDQLLAVRELQVSRVGASATKTILDECRGRLGMTAFEMNAMNPAGY